MTYFSISLKCSLMRLNFLLIVTVSITNFEHYLVNILKKKDYKKKVSENEDLVVVYDSKI